MNQHFLTIMPRGHEALIFLGLCMPASSLPPHHHLGQHNTVPLNSAVVCKNIDPGPTLPLEPDRIQDASRPESLALRRGGVRKTMPGEKGHWQADERIRHIRMQAGARATKEVPATTYAVARDLSVGKDRFVPDQKD